MHDTSPNPLKARRKMKDVPGKQASPLRGTIQRQRGSRKISVKKSRDFGPGVLLKHEYCIVVRQIRKVRETLSKTRGTFLLCSELLLFYACIMYQVALWDEKIVYGRQWRWNNKYEIGKDFLGLPSIIHEFLKVNLILLNKLKYHLC